jgi:hypothetical protein
MVSTSILKEKHRKGGLSPMNFAEYLQHLQPPLILSRISLEDGRWHYTLTCGEKQVSGYLSRRDEPDLCFIVATLLLYAGSDEADRDLEEGRKISREELNALFTGEQIAALYATNYEEY